MVLFIVRPAVNNLLETVDVLTKHTAQGDQADIIYLDFAKAFDTEPHKRLLSKLKAYGITGTLLKWIESFLSNGRQRVVIGDFFSEWESVTSGV